jgi:hypothetical protein
VTIRIAFNPCRSHGDSNPMRKMDVDESITCGHHRPAEVRRRCRFAILLYFYYTVRHVDRQKVHKKMFDVSARPVGCAHVIIPRVVPLQVWHGVRYVDVCFTFGYEKQFILIYLVFMY